jgi:hypothetical protein
VPLVLFAVLVVEAAAALQAGPSLKTPTGGFLHAPSPARVVDCASAVALLHDLGHWGGLLHLNYKILLGTVASIKHCIDIFFSKRTFPGKIKPHG